MGINPATEILKQKKKINKHLCSHIYSAVHTQLEIETRAKITSATLSVQLAIRSLTNKDAPAAVYEIIDFYILEMVPFFGMLN